MNEDLIQAGQLMQQALLQYSHGSFEQGDELRRQANQIYDANGLSAGTSNQIDMYGENKNFGIINAVLEENIKTLFLTDKGKVKVAHLMKVIREDKNLLAQHNIYLQLENVNDVENVSTYMNEAVKMIPYIPLNEIKKSNQKLVDFITVNKLNEDVEIPEKKLKLFESIETLLTTKKSIVNLSSYANATNDISNFIIENVNEEKNKKPLNEDDQDVSIDNLPSLLERLDVDKNKELTTEDKEFVKEIIAARQSGITERKKNIFNRLREEVMNALNPLLDESNDDIQSKQRLLSIKEKILNKEYDEDRLIEDVAYLLRVRDTIIT